MKADKWIRAGCLGVVLSMAGGPAWTVPQEQQNPPSSAERITYQTARDEKDAQAKIKLLDDFAARYPESTLAPSIYQDYYGAYFSLNNYPQAATYADKFLALGDKADFDSRMLALETREIAYSVGRCDSAFQTPEASAKARDAATQGLQMLDQWQKPANLTGEQFAAAKASFGIILHSAAADAESRLKGDAVVCYQAPQHDPGRLDRMIDEILSERRQTPRVR